MAAGSPSAESPAARRRWWSTERAHWPLETRRSTLFPAPARSDLTRTVTVNGSRLTVGGVTGSTTTLVVNGAGTLAVGNSSVDTVSGTGTIRSDAHRDRQWQPAHRRRSHRQHDDAGGQRSGHTGRWKLVGRHCFRHRHDPI